MAHVRGKPPFQQCLPRGRRKSRAGTEATAARLIMRATLAIKTTEAISNVESPQRGRERERKGGQQADTFGISISTKNCSCV